MMLGFVEGSSDVSGLGGSQVCKESMQNSITSIFLLLDYVPLFYEPAVIVQVQMSYDQATMDINTMYTYCAFDNYFASLGGFFGMGGAMNMTADIIANSNSETIKGIGELLNTDVNYNTILTLLKNL